MTENRQLNASEAPKKLVVAEVFGAKPKQDPIPPKRDSAIAPKKLDNPFVSG